MQWEWMFGTNLRYFSRWFSSAFFIFVSEVILSLISPSSQASEKQLLTRWLPGLLCPQVVLFRLNLGKSKACSPYLQWHIHYTIQQLRLILWCSEAATLKLRGHCHSQVNISGLNALKSHFDISQKNRWPKLALKGNLYPGCGRWSFTLRMYVASSTVTHLTFNLRRHDGATCSWRILQAGDNDFLIEGHTALCTADKTFHIVLGLKPINPPIAVILSQILDWQQEVQSSVDKKTRKDFGKASLCFGKSWQG